MQRLWNTVHFALAATQLFQKKLFHFDMYILTSIRSKCQIQCKIATQNKLLSRETAINNDPSTNGQTSLSGLVASYDNSLFDGESAFRNPSLKITSKYAHSFVTHAVSMIASCLQAQNLLKYLVNKSNDLSGMDSEVTVLTYWVPGFHGNTRLREKMKLDTLLLKRERDHTIEYRIALNYTIQPPLHLALLTLSLFSQKMKLSTMPFKQQSSNPTHSNLSICGIFESRPKVFQPIHGTGREQISLQEPEPFNSVTGTCEGTTAESKGS